MIKRVLLTGLMIVGFVFSQAQSSRDIVTQSTEWFVLHSNIKLHKKLSLAFDGQLRFVNDFESAQHLVRLGAEIYVTPKLSIIPIGYMYVWNFQYGEQPALYKNNEHRIWQQIAYKHSYRRLNFQHRFRIEQRFLQAHYVDLDGNVITDGYNTYLNRVRYRLQVQVPLNKAELEPGAWFVTVYDEIFYGWGDLDTFNKPDQNRVYTSIGFQLNKQFRIDGGPFYQLLIKKNGSQQENNVGCLIQLTYNFGITNDDI